MDYLLTMFKLDVLTGSADPQPGHVIASQTDQTYRTPSTFLRYQTDKVYLLIIGVYLVHLVYQYLRRRTKVTIRSLAQLVLLLSTLCLVCHYVQNYVVGITLSTASVLLHSRHVEHRMLPADRKAVLVTGCDTGIGHELAKQLDKLGYHVFAGCLVHGGPGDLALRAECSDRLTTLQLDVSNIQQIEDAYKCVEKQLGNNKLWGIVNNAGICFIGNIEIMTSDDMTKLLAVNFIGPLNICRTFLPLLRRSRGRLVNVASNSGLAPVPQMGVYCASKSALATLTEVLRYEMAAWGVKVSTIIPSGYRTGILAYNKSQAADRWWQSASPTVKQDYGIDCFTPKFKLANHQDATSTDLRPIVDRITHALSSVSPKSHYYSGLLARCLPFIYLHLPIWLSNHLMKVIADWFDFKPLALQKKDKKT